MYASTHMCSLVPRRGGGGGERAWFQLFDHVLNHGGIPLPLHTLDILPYACDVK